MKMFLWFFHQFSRCPFVRLNSYIHWRCLHWKLQYIFGARVYWHKTRLNKTIEEVKAWNHVSKFIPGETFCKNFKCFFERKCNIMKNRPSLALLNFGSDLSKPQTLEGKNMKIKFQNWKLCWWFENVNFSISLN